VVKGGLQSSDFNKRKNSINSLLIDGTLSTNRVEISEHIVQFYKILFTE
jgi:hypothetical protein